MLRRRKYRGVTKDVELTQNEVRNNNGTSSALSASIDNYRHGPASTLAAREEISLFTRALCKSSIFPAGEQRRARAPDQKEFA